MATVRRSVIPSPAPRMRWRWSCVATATPAERSPVPTHSAGTSSDSNARPWPQAATAVRAPVHDPQQPIHPQAPSTSRAHPAAPDCELSRISLPTLCSPGSAQARGLRCVLGSSVASVIAAQRGQGRPDPLHRHRLGRRVVLARRAGQPTQVVRYLPGLPRGELGKGQHLVPAGDPARRTERKRRGRLAVPSGGRRARPVCAA